MKYAVGVLNIALQCDISGVAESDIRLKASFGRASPLPIFIQFISFRFAQSVIYGSCRVIYCVAM